ncbi:MAG: PqqD family peptide modification chaperone, partial [Eubacteriaceae bacterium]
MIHKYNYKDQYIVLDINSGAVHVVNELVSDILDHYKEKKSDEIVEMLAEKYRKDEILDAMED